MVSGNDKSQLRLDGPHHLHAFLQRGSLAEIRQVARVDENVNFIGMAAPSKENSCVSDITITRVEMILEGMVLL